MQQGASFSRLFWKGMFSVFTISVFILLDSSFPSGRQSRFAGNLFACAASATAPVLTPISIDYPEDGSIFPPGITPPTFLWRDAAGTSWSIDITFADKTAPIIHRHRGEHADGADRSGMCAESNEPPKLTPQQAATWTWTPDADTWATIQAHSVGKRPRSRSAVIATIRSPVAVR